MLISLRMTLLALPIMATSIGCVARVETDPVPSKINVDVQPPAPRKIDVDVNVTPKAPAPRKVDVDVDVTPKP